ncbi:hypothetical protein ACFQ0K_02245 [Nocardioides caeni]|uniref:RNA polymerase subunit sigma n=1 Tax=Nocardioides caeni TaxID=574700 RepID=A0A4S8NN16_9ACTN|nr:hypothetical protein [Nocardioides caeni]THV18343.1 hypothetical protein E9934_01520 [Nocardioides caeni]
MDRSSDTAHQLVSDIARRLLVRVAEGDADALGSLYDLTSRAVHRLALLLTRDAEAAACLTIRSYERAWAEAATYDARQASPLVWLLAFVRAESEDLAPAA